MKKFSLMLLFLSATAANAQVVTVDVMKEKLDGEALVAKIFNEHAKDKNSKLYAQLKDIVVDSEGDDYVRFKDKPQLITADNIFMVSSSNGKYDYKTEYLVRIDEYSDMGPSHFWKAPRIFKVRIDETMEAGGPNQGQTDSRKLTIEEEVKIVSTKPSPEKFLEEPKSSKSSHR